MVIRRKLKYLVIGDVHLGHEKNRTVDIIRNLDSYFGNYSGKHEFAQLDAIFIAGDLFDRLLNYPNPDVHEIELWLGRLMRFCARHDIVLRILEGTPSHDRKQSKSSEIIYSFLEKKPDFRYIDTLHVEYIESLGLRVLYVPDEWTASTELTLHQTRELIANEGIDQVDIAIMHGAFAYQLPMAPATVPKHSEADYLSLVKHFIHIGHIHNFSVFERIIAEGSFDRIAHGEEDPKGGVVATLDPENGDSFDFVENKTAKVFKTIEVRNPDVDKCMEMIRKATAKVPDDSYIRIKTTKDHPIYQAFDELKLKFPMLNFTKMTKEDERDNYELIASVVTLDQSYTPIQIHRENIVGLVRDAVLSKNPLTDRQLQTLNSTLESTNV